MKKLITLMFLFSTSSVMANCKTSQTFNVEGIEHKLCYFKKGEAWVSPACMKKASCDALKIYEASTKKTVVVTEVEAEGGKNQSNIICQKLGGTVMMAKIPPRNSQQTFCQGKDKSLINANALD
ncbi:MAG TPA: hypothetical protein VNJ08_10240 [Bacteriovoracaceae bacterium]|nr:hypothetical protein [Bacteriovoracaceae bacterium]